MSSRLPSWVDRGVGPPTTATICVVASVRTWIVDYVVDSNTGPDPAGSNTRGSLWNRVEPDPPEGRFDAGCGGRPDHHPLHKAGAPMDINQSAKCEYCGTVMTTSDYDWVISAIKGLSNASGAVTASGIAGQKKKSAADASRRRKIK